MAAGQREAGAALNQRRHRPHDAVRRIGQRPKHRCAFLQEIELGIVERVAQGENGLDIAFDRNVAGKEQSISVETSMRESEECSNWTSDMSVSLPPSTEVRHRHCRFDRIERNGNNEWQVGRFEHKSFARVFAEPVEHRRVPASDRPNQMLQRKPDEGKRHKR